MTFDLRRRIAIPGNARETIEYAVEDWIQTAQHSIKDHGYFAVALSGGSTPKAIYQFLAKEKKEALDWKKVLLFWSDERAVPPEHPDSNYKMAMESLRGLPIPKDQMFRMQGEGDLEANAKAYEELIFKRIPLKRFDLIMLGIGEDGHTASLFPKTHGLHAEGRRVIANFLPDKDAWRLSLTYECIDQAFKTVVYVLGKSKAEIIKKIFNSPYLPDAYPIQRIGTEECPALFILDREAANDTF